MRIVPRYLDPPTPPPLPPEQLEGWRLALSLAGSFCIFVLAGLGLLVLAGACTPGAQAVGRAATPTLGEVVSRVDVGRVLECMGQPERWRCLGAAAASAALNLAADKAEAAARAAQDALSGAGADDVDEDEVAAELDAALEDLGAEIARTRGVKP